MPLAHTPLKSQAERRRNLAKRNWVRLYQAPAMGRWQIHRGRKLNARQLRRANHWEREMDHYAELALIHAIFTD